MIPVIVSIRPENFTSFGGRVKNFSRPNPLLLGTRQVRFLENPWKWPKIKIEKNAIRVKNIFDRYVFDPADFKKGKKKVKKFVRFWDNERKKSKFSYKLGFRPKKLSSQLARQHVIVLPFEFLARELESQTKTFSSALLSKLDNVFEFCSPSALSTGALWCHVK